MALYSACNGALEVWSTLASTHQPELREAFGWAASFPCAWTSRPLLHVQGMSSRAGRQMGDGRVA